jgi:hypothetical protein
MRHYTSVLAIASPDSDSPPAARKLLSFSAHGRKEIAELSGQVEYGTDEEAAAFLQTPGNGPASNRASRLLVTDSQMSLASRRVFIRPAQYAQAAALRPLTSEVVVFDLQSRKEILREYEL